MAYDKNSELDADSEHDEPLFILRMIRVEVPNSVLIEEYGLGFFEGDSMLSNVLLVFYLIPFEV